MQGIDGIHATQAVAKGNPFGFLVDGEPKKQQKKNLLKRSLRAQTCTWRIRKPGKMTALSREPWILHILRSGTSADPEKSGRECHEHENGSLHEALDFSAWNIEETPFSVGAGTSGWHPDVRPEFWTGATEKP